MQNPAFFRRNLEIQFPASVVSCREPLRSMGQAHWGVQKARRSPRMQLSKHFSLMETGACVAKVVKTFGFIA